MKIKKGEHKVKLVPSVDIQSHIPLGYMYGDEKVYACNIIQEYPAHGIRKIIPYERFDSYEKVFFESKVNQPNALEDLIPIEAGEYLKRDKLGYYYEPEASVKFEPYRFFYHVLAQRSQDYSTYKTFNLKINCIEKTSRLADALIQIFADAPDRGLVRHNVWVNNKDTSAKSLANTTLAENDFLFIETKNGETFSANDAKIDYEALLDQHTNLWLCCSDINLLETGTAQLSKSILYNEHLQATRHTFLSSSFGDSYLPAGGETLTFFSGDALGCIVKRYPNKGFIIISSDQFIEKASEHYKIIYEVLMQIYLQSYVETDAISGYICDEAIDYIVKRNNIMPSKGFRSEKTYYEMFNSYSANDFKLITVKLSSQDVKVSHSPDYIYFEKIGGPGFPKKPLNGYAVLLETQEVAYIDKWHYIADTQIAYTTTKYEEYMLLTLSPFCLNHVYSNKKVNIQMPLFTTKDYEKHRIENIIYYIVYRDMQYLCVESSKWDKRGTLIMTVYLYLTKAPIELIDMRVRGGGLPENKKDNYNLLDISHIEGRPFRKSGAYVIKLPIEAKPYHDEIMKQLNKISVADRFFSVIYEQRSDDLENN